MNRQPNHTKEYLLYAILFGITFLFPFLHVGEIALDKGVFHWNFILQKWMETLPFVVLVIIHIFLLQPILFEKKQTKKYIVLLVLTIVLFFAYVNCRHSNREPYHPNPVQTEPPHLKHHTQEIFSPPLQDAPKISEKQNEFKLSGPIVMDTIIAILLLGCSLTIKLMFKHYENSRKMEQLENAQIRQELLQLKAQISPHFFMNSLNNIHGMIEIDSPKAQDMILELSGMMRYVLYESSTPMITLSKELDFLRNYISLMQVRYNSNKVSVKYTFPNEEELSSIKVPPLLFIVFIENAFKHGVDYQHSSFINIELSIDKHILTLQCINSLHKNKEKTIGGIGLDNIRKRLDIIYNNDYSLDLSILDKIFIVSLTIPTKQ